MAQSLKSIKNRIKSTQNTHKVTNALEMISVTKLNRMGRQLVAGRAYFYNLEGIFFRLLKERPGLCLSLYCQERPAKKNFILCLFTSDNGLCGSYNNAILHLVDDFVQSHGRDNVSLVVVGKKGFKHCQKKGYTILYSYLGLNGKYSQEVADKLNTLLITEFTSGKADAVFFGHTHFETSLLLRPRISQFLPLVSKDEKYVDYIFEESLEKVFNRLLQQYFEIKVRMVMLDAFNSEHAARTVAMKTATENASNLLTKLILLRNKVRQANITRDVLEIISSAEALKG